MTINEYQKDALRTVESSKDGLSDNLRLLEGLLGLNGEAGECIDLYKKYLFQGHKLDERHVALELGDVAWYLAVAADAIGYDLETILRMNVDKRKARYPDGFDKNLSINRKPEDI